MGAAVAPLTVTPLKGLMVVVMHLFPRGTCTALLLRVYVWFHRSRERSRRDGIYKTNVLKDGSVSQQLFSSPNLQVTTCFRSTELVPLQSAVQSQFLHMSGKFGSIRYNDLKRHAVRYNRLHCCISIHMLSKSCRNQALLACTRRSCQS